MNNVHHFDYLIGYQKTVYKPEDPANIQAAELLGKFHDSLFDIGYKGHALEVYLVRILYILFSEDTTIFNRRQFQDFIENRTSEDGSDLAPKIQQLFQVLNTPVEERFKNLDEDLAEFPYVNGGLFSEVLPVASFDRKMRKALLECCYFNWQKISPSIFGSMFQSVMNPEARRNLGAHYTSEKNILKVIKPLFLDELWAEFERVRLNRNLLIEFHKKLGKLKFFDPACGCGNFLVVTYREMRLLELEVLRELNKEQQLHFDFETISRISFSQFYGIEIEEFPARIAEVAMWLIDHQMNIRLSEEFGGYFVRLPLQKSATIINADALETDWEEVVAKDALSYIFGNPPFIGSKLMKAEQRAQITRLFAGIPGSGVLDYVTGWYQKAAEYIKGTGIKVAFLSTNSIVQGEQTGILWGHLRNHFNIKIHFAHRTFKWSNEARENAAVYCVIVGFAGFDVTDKRIFEYDDIRGDAHEVRAKNINPYLIDAPDILVEARGNPICQVPEIKFGNMPLDGGHLLLTDEERSEFLRKEPAGEKYIYPLVSAYEYLNGIKRWCLWLAEASPAEIHKMPEILKRVDGVRKFRLDSVRELTVQKAKTPALFGEIRDFGDTYILIPSTTSENRLYIPMGFFKRNHIPNNSCHIITNGGLYHFGVMMSKMHMAWVNVVCGRLKGDYRYSKNIVYNNYPWPENPSKEQVATVERAAQRVLDVRNEYPDSSLADLYDPLTMPTLLVGAPQALDRAVDLAYRPQPFLNDTKRMEYLFELYEKCLGSLFHTKKKR
ncbi:MAG: N-6 DNA methylase [Ignavibacteriales bacterium]|nr:hypothetical protein [Ignavibacteriaceae bacterium]MCZ2142226.1 N-6 DNA methylase [Ignavibacteriales bacterium]WKZ71577.1 MAG: N-6 DNA methylase [Ignavibacteriaceae bacterium]